MLALKLLNKFPTNSDPPNISPCALTVAIKPRSVLSSCHDPAHKLLQLVVAHELCCVLWSSRVDFTPFIGTCHSGWERGGGALKAGALKGGARRVGHRSPIGPKAGGDSHDSPRSQTCTFDCPGLRKHHPNSTRRPPVREREKKRTKMGAGEGKKQKFWAVRRRAVRWRAVWRKGGPAGSGNQVFGVWGLGFRVQGLRG